MPLRVRESGKPLIVMICPESESHKFITFLVTYICMYVCRTGYVWRQWRGVVSSLLGRECSQTPGVLGLRVSPDRLGVSKKSSLARYNNTSSPDYYLLQSTFAAFIIIIIMIVTLKNWDGINEDIAFVY